MPTVHLSQGATYYERSGTGPSLVFIHGMGGDATLWNEHAAALEGRFTVVRYDIIGHGRSATLPGPWRYEQFARQLADLLDYLKIARAVVCGFSLGGNIAQCFALEHPERTAGLVVVSSACARTPEEQAAVDQRVDQVSAGGPPAVVDGALARWFGPEFAAANPDVIAYWRAKTRANDHASYLEAYRLYVDNDRQLLSRLSGIHTPTLVLTGDKDRGQTPRMAREMQSRIAGAELAIFAGVYHMLPIEAAGLLASAIADFAVRA